MKTNPTIYLKNYQPYSFSLEQVDLDFELYQDHALVHNRMQFKRLHPGELYLHGEELELIAITMDDKPLSPSDYTLNAEGLTLTTCPDHFILNLTTRIRPQDNTQLSGLYRSNNLFCTQCEAEGFRRITFYPDRPDVLSVFSTRICADKARFPLLLSNGNPLECGDLNDGRHWIRWHDPFKKPGYLFALVAGQLACVRDEFCTSSGKLVKLEIYVEHGNEDQCTHAMASLKRAMRWDEEHYGREYDLDIYMIVAVSDFNMGAMENKGLNIFNSKFILARPDTATDQDYINIESVVAHEYFHNWTGNRVTCRDWFQLSLKEGLTVFRDQEFTRDMYSRDVNRIADINELRTIQFPEDAGSMAHPVQPSSYQEINNFYTATIYNKGAEVIRMQHTLLGASGFRRGMDLYFARHDGQAVAIEEFVKAMEDANDVDFSQLRRWYAQAGTPHVAVTSHYDKQCLRLTLKQTCRQTPESTHKLPFLIPIKIALFDEHGQSLPIAEPLLQLTETEQTFEFTDLPKQPVVSLLRDFSAPIMLEQQLSPMEWMMLLRYETNGFAKWNAAQTLFMQRITTCYNTNNTHCSLDNTLIDTWQHVLTDEALDQALRAELLTPPSFEEIANVLPEIDVSRAIAARDALYQALGSGLFKHAETLYAGLWQQEDHAMNTQAFARRKLRNLCLWLMMKANAESTCARAHTQFYQSQTMTDKMASLSLLVNCAAEIREPVLADFYQQWHKHDLVIDKWFTVQAGAETADTLTRVQTLLTHEAFSFKNPNKVRALIGAFTQNARHFHAIDGSGYAFLTEMLLKMDKINPQISARLATPLTRWQRVDKPRQDLIQVELHKLADAELSRDLREMVTKSLRD